jgi:hypothetical protein
MPDRLKEITVAVDDVSELFQERRFNPFTDDAGAISSIAGLAQAPHLVSELSKARLHVVLPADKITPDTERHVQAALQRYCAHMTAEVRQRLAAMRWVGLRTSLIGIIFFGLSVIASAAAQRLAFVPDQLRTIASESIIVAGWVLLWQPLDTLVQGWWPQWQEERTFRALGAIPLRVSAAPAVLTKASR